MPRWTVFRIIFFIKKLCGAEKFQKKMFCGFFSFELFFNTHGQKIWDYKKKLTEISPARNLIQFQSDNIFFIEEKFPVIVLGVSYELSDKSRLILTFSISDHVQWRELNPGPIQVPIGVWQGQTEPVLASVSQIPRKRVILANGRFYRSTLLRFPARLSKKHTTDHVKKRMLPECVCEATAGIMWGSF